MTNTYWSRLADSNDYSRCLLLQLSRYDAFRRFANFSRRNQSEISEFNKFLHHDSLDVAAVMRRRMNDSFAKWVDGTWRAAISRHRRLLFAQNLVITFVQLHKVNARARGVTSSFSCNRSASSSLPRLLSGSLAGFLVDMVI